MGKPEMDKRASWSIKGIQEPWKGGEEGGRDPRQAPPTKPISLRLWF